MRWFVSTLIAAFLLVDFLPHYGPPHFRYTGSDPSLLVYNIGWPMALFIYDPRTGVHVAPWAYMVIPVQIIVLAIAGAVLLMTRRVQQRNRLKTA